MTDEYTPERLRAFMQTCHDAVYGEGDYASVWKDKPHRVVMDCTSHGKKAADAWERDRVKLEDVEREADTYSTAWEQAREELEAARLDNEKLREEVATLRQYGNKDCTAMADKALSAKRDAKPDWLPAPDTMPENLAPAQMVEGYQETQYSGQDVLAAPQQGTSRADKAPWSNLDWYRPIYSNSGLKMVSAEGLERWARYVGRGITGRVMQFASRPNLEIRHIDSVFEDAWAVQIGTGVALAPDTHRIPGDWWNSLAEVMQ